MTRARSPGQGPRTRHAPPGGPCLTDRYAEGGHVRSDTTPPHCHSYPALLQAKHPEDTHQLQWSGPNGSPRYWRMQGSSPLPRDTPWPDHHRWRPAAIPTPWAGGPHTPGVHSASGRRRLRRTRRRSQPDDYPAGDTARQAAPDALPALATSVADGSHPALRENCGTAPR